MTCTVKGHGVRSQECPDITIRVASTRSDREGAFRLAYHSYLRADLCGPSTLGMRITPYQLLISTDIIVAELRGEVISTLSFVRDGELGLPMECVYPEEVSERRRAGLRLAEVSCLADRRQGFSRYYALFWELARMVVQISASEGIDQVLIAVHPRHAKMYCRAMGFARIGDNRQYPAVNDNPAVPLCLDFATVQSQHPAIWQRYLEPPLPCSVLQSRPISLQDCRHFAKLVARGGGRPHAADQPTRDENQPVLPMMAAV